ncbi:olfactory receptor 142-like [Erpetoichthys calabaricus]|uniref:olfactory receptor 142-like n=1 Tax=Erpetoichthys calabaricus TaxID=27687 RepID=UPI002234B8EC|nr:olfactory receptor 142-like [Erpetoichthys calabaricus]
MTSEISKNNDTFVRPQTFFVTGFLGMPYSNYYYIFLLFIYILTLLANSLIILLIYVEESLHSPKYVAVVHLAIVDIFASSTVVPRMIHSFLFDAQVITYEACLSDMFFSHFFAAMESFSLIVLAYDRFVAICFPLRYHIIVSHTKMLKILGMTWFLAFIIVGILVALITRLSFCKSTVVTSYFCDHGPVYHLACNDTYPNFIMARIFITSVFFAPLTLIVCSYAAILNAVLKIASAEGRRKAMLTCTSHLILVAIFYIPISGTYIASMISGIHQNARIFNNSLSATIPALLNPIIYTLKTEEILNAVKMRYKRRTAELDTMNH